MNKLIRKALNEGILRLANLPDLDVGTKVVTDGWDQGEVLAHYQGQVVFGWDDGEVNTFTYGERHQIYLAPLCFVEGKPVYKGDVLYSLTGAYTKERITISHVVRPNSSTLYVYGQDGIWDMPEQLTWTKPVTTININGHEVPMPEREAPGEGTEYFFPSLQYQGGTDGYTWVNDVTDNRLLSAGMVHLTEEAAKKHAEALASFTREQ